MRAGEYAEGNDAELKQALLANHNVFSAREPRKPPATAAAALRLLLLVHVHVHESEPKGFNERVGMPLRSLVENELLQRTSVAETIAKMDGDALKRHARFLRMHLTMLSGHYVSLDTSRMTALS